MFRKSLSYFKIAAKTLARSSELLYKPGVNAVRQLTKQTGENIIEINSLPGAKFAIDNLAVFGRDVNQALPVVAKETSQKAKAYSQLLANNLVAIAKEFGKNAGILNEEQCVKECIMEYLIQKLAEYAVSLHVDKQNKDYVGDHSDIRHIPGNQANFMALLLAPMVNRLVILGVKNAHELAQKAYQVLLDCKEQLAEQLYVADLDQYAYKLSAEEIIAYGKSSYGPNPGLDKESKRDQLIQQYRERLRNSQKENSNTEIDYSVKVEKNSPF